MQPHYMSRTGLMAALVLLGLNDLELAVDPANLYELVTGVATRAFARAQIAVFFQQHSRGRDPA
jgi:prophage maintenance system killer protein